MLIERVNSNLFPTYTKKDFKPSFGYNLPKEPVSDIREISHLTCACCGDQMIRPSKFNEFLQRFIAPAKQALENSTLDKYKDSKAYQFLKYIVSSNPRKTIHSIIRMDENIAKVRDLSIDEQLELSKLITDAENVTVPAPKVLKIFGKYNDYFSDNYKSLFKVLKKYSKNYPNKTFSEIFNRPRIINAHKKSLEDFNKRSVMDRVKIFVELQTLPGITPSIRKSLQQINSSSIAIFNSEYYQPHIKKALVEKLYSDFASTLENKALRENVMKLVGQFSYEDHFVDKFILNCVKSGKSDMDIVRVISEELLATFEHVQLKSKDGTKAQSNGIVLCKKCNRERSNVDYSLFLGLHPEMIKNMQKQINRVVSFINNRKLIGYDSYPIDIKKTLLNFTDNILHINIRKFFRFYQKGALNDLEKAEARLSVENEKYDKANDNLQKIDLKLEEALAVVRKLKKERHIAQETFSEVEKNKKAQELDVFESRETLDNIKTLMAEDIDLNKKVRKNSRKKS